MKDSIKAQANIHETSAKEWDYENSASGNACQRIAMTDFSSACNRLAVSTLQQDDARIMCPTLFYLESCLHLDVQHVTVGRAQCPTGQLKAFSSIDGRDHEACILHAQLDDACLASTH